MIESNPREDAMCEVVELATIQVFESLGMTATPLAPQGASGSSDSAQVSARVKFHGAGCAGYLGLSCALGVVPVDCDTDSSRRDWVKDCTSHLVRRVKNRLRQYGVCVDSDPVELIGAQSELQGRPSKRKSFSTAGGRVHVYFETNVDVELLTSAEPVPMRDEGDIILF